MRIAHKTWNWLVDQHQIKHLSQDKTRAFAILNIVCLLALVSILSVLSMILAFGSPIEQVRFDIFQNAASFAMYGDRKSVV